MNKLNILITGPPNNQKAGGIRTYIESLKNCFLISASPFIVEHLVSTLGEHNNESWAKKIKRNLSNLPNVYRKGINADIIHINSTFDQRSVIRDSLYVILYKIFLRKIIVIQFHGGDPEKLSLINWQIGKKIFGYILNSSDAILLLSEYQKSKLMDICPNLSIQIIKNYIDIRTKHRENEIKKNKNLTTFLFMSRLIENKGIFEILKAAKILKKRKINFRIFICGEGPDKNKILNLLEFYKVNSHIKFLGYVSGDLKENILRISDVMLLPTWHKEGMPFSILEGFKFGIPVITTHAGGIKDLVEDGCDGIIINAHDHKMLAVAMEMLIKNKELLGVMSRNVKKKIKTNYSLIEMKNKLEFLYFNLLKS